MMGFSYLLLVSILLAATLSSATEINVKKFLADFGYLHHENVFSSSITGAIKRMQAFAHLPVTGVVDEATVRMMKTPRCGRPDDEADFRYAYRKWDHHDLLYYFENYTPDLDVLETERIIADAFQLWADVTPLTFRQFNNTGDFSIVFGRRYHAGGWGGRGRCNARFDGRGGVLAHAYFPPDGRAHFDEDETFTDKTRSGINLFWVAAHEFGHALGLPHSKVRGALMYPYYTGYKENFYLPQDDITRIQRLYGPRTTLAPGETTKERPTRPINTKPINTLPGNCYDQHGEAYCKARVSVCGTSHDGWREFMKKYCYKTCYCSPLPPSRKPTDPVQPETLVPTKPITQKPGQTTVPKSTTQRAKVTGAACVDKAGDYCKNHVTKCNSEDPVWKSYVKRNCFKTCFC